MTWTPANIVDLEPLPTRRIPTPAPMAQDPLFEEAIEHAIRVVDGWAGEPSNAWAVSHGLQARGPAFKLLDGRMAVQGLFQDYAEEFEAGGHTFLRFPNKKGEVRVEPHTDQILKILGDVGVDPATMVEVGGRPYTVKDLWRGCIARSYLVPERHHASYGSTDDIAWSLQAIAAWVPPHFEWEAIDGTPMSLDRFTTYANAVLITETKFLAEAMASGKGFERKGQGVFHYICGGAHLLQGVGYAIARGNGTDRDRLAFSRQFALWFYRMPREVLLYDASLAAAPQHKVRLAVQRMAFTGHFVESMHKLAAYGLFTPNAEQKKAMEFAARQAANAILTLKQAKVLDHMPELRRRDPQLYLDVVGDSAHTLFALELALGRQSVVL